MIKSTLTRRQRVLEALLSGTTGRDELAAAAGVTTAAVSVIMSRLRTTGAIGGDVVDGYKIMNQERAQQLLHNGDVHNNHYPLVQARYCIAKVLQDSGEVPVPRSQLAQVTGISAALLSRTLQAMLWRGMIDLVAGGYIVADAKAIHRLAANVGSAIAINPVAKMPEVSSMATRLTLLEQRVAALEQLQRGVSALTPPLAFSLVSDD